MFSRDMHSAHNRFPVDFGVRVAVITGAVRGEWHGRWICHYVLPADMVERKTA
jgi:hypothetical protein